jgi:hypothetical protein
MSKPAFSHMDFCQGGNCGVARTALHCRPLIKEILIALHLFFVKDLTIRDDVIL